MSKNKNESRLTTLYSQLKKLHPSINNKIDLLLNNLFKSKNNYLVTFTVPVMTKDIYSFKISNGVIEPDIEMENDIIKMLLSNSIENVGSIVIKEITKIKSEVCIDGKTEWVPVKFIYGAIFADGNIKPTDPDSLQRYCTTGSEANHIRKNDPLVKYKSFDFGVLK